MGIRGLTEYVHNSADLYFEPYELQNTFLVIDGYCLIFCLSCTLEEESYFSGDYDAYYKIVKDFFLGLAKCNVTPIVLLDGGMEKRKIKTILSRRRENVESLALCSQKMTYMAGLNVMSTFLNVLVDLKVTHIQCCLEADNEIASVAAALNCPVLSNDSDFYMHDVLYIPFEGFEMEPVQVKLSNTKSLYHIKCLLFKMSNFLEVNDLKKSLIPLLISFLGNDYHDGFIFNQFFNHVIMPKSSKSLTQRKIHAVLQWLKKENYESAIKGILLHVRKKDWNKILRIIKSNKDEYAPGPVSLFVYTKVNQLLSSQSNELKAKNPIVNWPQEIDTLFHECKLYSYCMDMINLSLYVTSTLIEDCSQVSVHYHSIGLIRAIFKILCHYVPDKKSDSLRVYLRQKKQFTSIVLGSDDTLENVDLRGIFEKSQTERLSLLYRILQFEESDVEIVSNFPDSWMLLVASFIYFCKACSDLLTSTYLHAIILMMVANKVVQGCVGYHKSYFTFFSKYKKLLKELENEEIKVVHDEHDIKGLLNSVSLPECVLVQKELMSLRGVNKVMQKMFDTPTIIIKTVHWLNCFQSCVTHINQVNILLNSPLAEVRFPDFYSGTLLFNLYLGIKYQGLDGFTSQILSRGPNVMRVYRLLCQVLSKYFTNVAQVSFRGSKAKANRKKRVESLSEQGGNTQDCLLQKIQTLLV